MAGGTGRGVVLDFGGYGLGAEVDLMMMMAALRAEVDLMMMMAALGYRERTVGQRYALLEKAVYSNYSSS